MRGSGRFALGVSVLLAFGAAPKPVLAKPTHALRFNAPLDLSITLSGTALWVTLEILKPTLKPNACRWCEVGAFAFIDGPARRSLQWPESNMATANTLASVLTFGVAPLGAAVAHLGVTGARTTQKQRELGENLTIIAEATVIAMDFNQVVKFLVGRERPFVHQLPASEKDGTDNPNDNNLSFFSGHTTAAFAVATAAGTVASLRGYAAAPVIWGGGLALATTVGYLRIASGRHYFSDAATGAVVGSLAGALMPLAFHPRSKEGVTVGLGGNAMVASGMW